MKQKKFNLWMTSIDDNYLEEAAATPKKHRNYRIAVLAVAACLVLAAIGLLFRHTLLPKDEPDNHTHHENFANNETEDDITREQFFRDGTEYTLLSCESSEPMDISGMEAAEAEPLVWYAGGLEIKLCSVNDTAWASWYDANTGTQWCLTTEASTLALLTTASEIVGELGYNVAVAPEGAAEITYDAFLLNDLTVAETTFLLNNVRYHYCMAATVELATPFADISGTGTNYDNHLTTEVGWCPAELYFNENGAGKIIWFDIVPGLLYSLSMETNASEEALLSLAHEIFAPAQDAADW